MKTYSVKDIAKLLNVSEETVRRWIRNKKLEAAQDSRKMGNIITETMLKTFLENHSKYDNIATLSLTSRVSDAFNKDLQQDDILSNIYKWQSYLNESDEKVRRMFNDYCSELATCVRRNLKSYFEEKYGSNFFEDIWMKRIVLNGEDLERFEDYMQIGAYKMKGERR